MKPNLVNPNTSKIVSYEYNHSTLYENMSEGMQKATENVFWLILKDGKDTLVQITKTMHQGRSCFICDLERMRGTFMSPYSLAKSYDELAGNQLPTFKSLEYLNDQPAEQKGEK